MDQRSMADTTIQQVDITQSVQAIILKTLKERIAICQETHHRAMGHLSFFLQDIVKLQQVENSPAVRAHTVLRATRHR